MIDSMHGNGVATPYDRPASAPAPVEWTDAARQWERLHATPALTVGRDRWERLVTSIDVAATPDRVWQALTEPNELRDWLAVCRGSLARRGRECVLDFEDGEFFLCRAQAADAPYRLQYLWRWLGLGQATQVTWHLESCAAGTRVTVTEEASNPPSDWQTWNGGGWTGILEQLAAYLRTGTSWRWPWRRMGPYAQIELSLNLYEAWDRLISPAGLKYWLQTVKGGLTPGNALTVLMGDASGSVELAVRDLAEPGERPPSFLPHVAFSLVRPVWRCEIGGRLWLEPAGWGRCLLQVFHFNWENLPAELQLSERKLVANFWAGAAHRASLVCQGGRAEMGPHNW
jgi:uncharacterized protein YndB with AHSA1/START domain